MADRIYTATAYARGARRLGSVERLSREQAVDLAFEHWPKAEWVSSGYGYQGGFHIQSIKRWEWESAQTLHKAMKVAAEHTYNQALAMGILLEDAHEVECDPDIETKKAVARVLYTDTDAIGAIMPDGTKLDQWDERLRSVGASPIFPPSYEPIRPLRAPDDGSHYCHKMILGPGWLCYYGLDWPSRSYWLVPNNDWESV